MEWPKGKLLSRLFDQDPYAGFPAADYPLDHTGFGLPRKALGLVAEVKPARIVEVGTWKGNSAFYMADRLRDLGLEFELVCVDTWLGSREMWLPYDRDVLGRRSGLGLKHGYPTVYYQFLANVIKKGYRGSIVPLPAPANVAYQVLRTMGYRAQFVYIDGSHDVVDARHDVDRYWRLLERGGIICGDDFYWEGVRIAVDRLVARTGCRLELAPEEASWWVRKP